MYALILPLKESACTSNILTPAAPDLIGVSLIFMGISERIFFCLSQYASKSSGAGRLGFISSGSNAAPASKSTSLSLPSGCGIFTNILHFKNPASFKVPDTLNFPPFNSPEKFRFMGTESFVIEPLIFKPSTGFPPFVADRTNSAVSPFLYSEPSREAFKRKE